MYNRLNPLVQFLDEMGLSVPAGQLLTITQGQTVRMSVSFRYRGPELKSVSLRCSIGTRILGVFYESVYASKPISLPQSVNFADYSAYADIPTSGLSPSVGYDIEAKISEYTAATLVKIDNVIDVIAAVPAPEFQNFAIVSYEVVKVS